MTGDVEVLARAARTGITFLARLISAPFPIEDRTSLFFDARDPATGERCHTGPEGPLAESRHFADDRVLFHVPAGFKPDRPLTLLVFFHGHRTELRRTLIGELALTRQVDAAKRNVVLVAPQLALDAADSHPGKLAEPGGFARFLDEAVAVLSDTVPGIDRSAAIRAPLVLAAFSGGYRSLAYCLEQDGGGHAVLGAVLFDAIYGEIERLRSWLEGPGRQGFFLCLYGDSSRDGTAALAAGIEDAGIPVRTAYPRRLGPGAVHLVSVATPHDLVPLVGPPSRPIADLLRRLD